MRTGKAVILLSGGLDSSVCAYMARQDLGKAGELYALNISYGQVHIREATSAQYIADEVGASLQRIHVPLDWLMESSLLGDGDIPVEGLTEEIPSTWVPQRNSIFLALAFAYAEARHADFVYAGMNCRDYSGYPDCRPEFLMEVEKALNLGSKRYVETGYKTSLETPLLYMGKSDIVKVGNLLGVDFGKTWSCYQGRERACGVCDSCRIRLAAFKEVGLVDPIEYEIREGHSGTPVGASGPEGLEGGRRWNKV